MRTFDPGASSNRRRLRLRMCSNAFAATANFALGSDMHTVASMESVYVFIHVEKTIASLCERRDGLKNLRIALLIAILIQRLLVYAVWVVSWTP